jgi:hypothetical protein
MTGKQEANGKRNYKKTLCNCCYLLNIIGVIKSRNVKRRIKIRDTYSEHTFSTESNEVEVSVSWFCASYNDN